MSDELTPGELHDLKHKAEMWDAHVADWKAGKEQVAPYKMEYDRDQLQLKLYGWRLVHFAGPGGTKKERYSATKDEAGVIQSAGTQELLIQRCESWDAEQESRKQKPDRTVAVKAS